MKKIIAFSGKGGVGKTTRLVLLLKYLIDINKDKDILVIDSDPDANVADVIGEDIKFCDTIGGKMKVLKDKIQSFKVGPNEPKNQLIESDVFNCLIEMDEFDLGERLIIFSVLIIEITNEMSNTKAGNPLFGQLVRSGTSVFVTSIETVQMNRNT